MIIEIYRTKPIPADLAQKYFYKCHFCAKHGAEMKCYCNHVRNVDFSGSYQTPICMKVKTGEVDFMIQTMFNWSIPHSQMISFRAIPPLNPITPLNNFVIRLMLKNNTD